MIVLHTFLTLAAGFAAMALLLTLATLLARVLGWQSAPTHHAVPTHQAASTQQATPRPVRDSPIALAWNLGSTLLAALVGGYVTATLAHLNPLIHALALALIVLLLGALSALQTRGQAPIWFALLLLALAPCAVVLGGMLRLWQLGIG